VKACKTIAGQGVLALVKTPSDKKAGTATGARLQQTGCIKCGQCTLACRSSALMEKDELPKLEAILANPDGKALVA
jgi:predicted molibdopterin-dependent oxidoreductase YjgC